MAMSDALIEELIQKITLYAQKHVSKSRFEHSVRTAQTAASFCKKFGLYERLGYLAGISHDICKGMTEEKLLEYAALDGNPISDMEKEKPALLHGRAAAVILKTKFGIQDSDLLEAVSCHTFGKPNMCELSKILFVSDKIEPGRDFVTKSYLKKLEGLSLNELFEFVVQDNVVALKKKGKSVAPETLLLLETF